MKVKFKKFFQIIIFKEKKFFFVKETKKKSHFATLLFKQRVNLSIAKYQKHCYIDCYCSISQASINLRKRKTLLLDSIKYGAKRNEKQNKKPYEGNGTGSETELLLEHIHWWGSLFSSLGCSFGFPVSRHNIIFRSSSLRHGRWTLTTAGSLSYVHIRCQEFQSNDQQRTSTCSAASRYGSDGAEPQNAQNCKSHKSICCSPPLPKGSTETKIPSQNSSSNH